MDFEEEERLVSWVEKLDWDEVARLLLSVKLEIESEEKDSAILSKQLGILKRILAAKLKQAKSKKVIEVGFLLGLVRSIETMEKRLEKMAKTRSDILLFLKAVVVKLEKEGKLVKDEQPKDEKKITSGGVLIDKQENL
ncbi:MAG: hypothetical protein QW035_00260 [Candidatus Anstonellales archaeon]